MLIALKNPAHHSLALQAGRRNAREIANGERGCAEPRLVLQRNRMLRCGPDTYRRSRTARDNEDRAEGFVSVAGWRLTMEVGIHTIKV